MLAQEKKKETKTQPSLLLNPLKPQKKIIKKKNMKIWLVIANGHKLHELEQALKNSNFS